MSDAPSPVVNPLIERGFVPSTAEYNLICSGLVELVDRHPEAKRPCQNLMGRLSQIVQSGDSVPQEKIDKFKTRIRKAIAEHDPDKTAAGIEALLSATYRQDPDPARRNAIYCMEILGELVREQEHANAMLLERFSAILTSARSDFERSGWPAASDLMAWIVDTLGSGAENLREGVEPWPDDDDE